MKASFRLGVVLRLRELSEDAVRIELVASLRAHGEAVDALRRLRAAAAAERDRMGELQRASREGSGTAAGDLVDATLSADWAERAVVVGEERVAAMAGTLLEARGKLAEAKRRRQVVERLRDRFVLTERLRLERRDEAALNEIASVRRAWASIEEALR